VQTGPDRAHLVELYTSEGCDSCPPAEKWLYTLRQHPGLVGLEFHVTYWDGSGWHDPFDAQAHTDRQKMLAKRGNHEVIYTPQIWIDGHIWHNWPKGAPPGFVDKASSPLTATVDIGPPLRTTFDATGADSKDNDKYRLYAAVIENGLVSSVTGGENKGKTFTHDDVVRAFDGPLSLPHAQAQFTLPEHADLAKSSVVGFVVNDSNGEVTQVVQVPLASCLKR
jgi:hypothetical protein